MLYFHQSPAARKRCDLFFRESKPTGLISRERGDEKTGLISPKRAE